jgi:hypothetical protein
LFGVLEGFGGLVDGPVDRALRGSYRVVPQSFGQFFGAVDVVAGELVLDSSAGFLDPLADVLDPVAPAGDQGGEAGEAAFVLLLLFLLGRRFLLRPPVLLKGLAVLIALRSPLALRGPVVAACLLAAAGVPALAGAVTGLRCTPAVAATGGTDSPADLRRGRLADLGGHTAGDERADNRDDDCEQSDVLGRGLAAIPPPADEVREGERQQRPPLGALVPFPGGEGEPLPHHRAGDVYPDQHGEEQLGEAAPGAVGQPPQRAPRPPHLKDQHEPGDPYPLAPHQPAQHQPQHRRQRGEGQLPGQPRRHRRPGPQPHPQHTQQRQDRLREHPATHHPQLLRHDPAILTGPPRPPTASGHRGLNRPRCPTPA